MNLVYNMAFLDNTSKIFDIFLRPTHRVSETSIKIYSDAATSDTTTTVPSIYCLFVPASFLNILNKINDAYWNESIDIVANNDRLKLLTNTILNGNDTQRNSALDKLVSMGVIQSGDVTVSKTLASRLTTFNPSLMVRNYNTEENFYKFTYNIPLGLERKYSDTRNPQYEKLFLLFVGRGPNSNGYYPATGETFGYFTKFWNGVSQKDALSMGYIAVDLGAVGSATDETIKYDHLDEIEYFDNIIIQLSIPNQYT